MIIQRLVRGVLALGGVLFLSGWVLTQPLMDGWMRKVSPIGAELAYQTSIPSNLLETHIKNITTGLSPRDYQHPDNLKKTAAYIENHFRSLNLSVRTSAFQEDGKEYLNVYAEAGGPSNEIIVVGAHYDTAGPFPGADDNASGVAGLLELGRLLSLRAAPIKVVLAAYALEEPPFFRTPFMGSAVHVRELQKARTNVRLMIALEMIGYFSDEPGSQHFPVPGMNLLYPTTGNFIGVVSTLWNAKSTRVVKSAMSHETPLPVYSLNAPREVPGVDFSDHLNFIDAGYPAIMITDTADNRNEAYHTPDDTIYRLDFQRMAMVVDGVYAAINAVGKRGQEKSGSSK